MKTSYLAIDLGATSGRAIVGTLDGMQLTTVEINRFSNEFVPQHKHLFWNIYKLFEEILKSLQIAQQQGYAISSIGIDTWGVDFALLDSDGYLSGLPFAYRDSLTNGIVPIFEQEVMTCADLYEKTGIQIMQLNSIFQLYAQHQAHLSSLHHAQCLLFTPDVLAYLLTDNISVEYTIASTSALLNAKDRHWDFDIIHRMQLPSQLFPEIIAPASIRGYLSDELCRRLNIPSIPVIAVASHDTASAVAAIPATGHEWAFLSMGTWSLMGIETAQPIINPQAFSDAFTNEGGINNTIRFLKNLTGFWLLEQCITEWKKLGLEVDYRVIDEQAAAAPPFARFIDTDDALFTQSGNMLHLMNTYFDRTQQSVPATFGEWARCIFESLAMKYRTTFTQLQQHSPFELKTLHAIGGGTKNTLLCQFVANALQVPVIAGPTEATAAGNLLVQALALKQLTNHQTIREVVQQSYETNTYLPQNATTWEYQYHRYANICFGSTASAPIDVLTESACCE